MDLLYNNKVYNSFADMVYIINTQVTTSINGHFLNGIENSINFEIIISTEKKLRTSRVKYKLLHRDYLKKLKSRE
jgi:hypothetical protein